MNKDHIVHLPGSLDRVSCQHLIDVFESLNEYHGEGRIGDYRIAVSYTHLRAHET